MLSKISSGVLSALILAAAIITFATLAVAVGIGDAFVITLVGSTALMALYLLWKCLTEMIDDFRRS